MASKVHKSPRDVDKKTKAALQVLFDLLEAYAPPWYTEELREKARFALIRPQDTVSEKRWLANLPGNGSAATQ